jgi:hypothetical protein
MILQYSENPFAGEEDVTHNEIIDRTQKQRVLSKLLLIAGNFFEKYPASNLNFYKRRYEFEL